MGSKVVHLGKTVLTALLNQSFSGESFFERYREGSLETGKVQRIKGILDWMQPVEQAVLLCQFADVPACLWRFSGL
jgi:hypothetical protein